MQTTTIKQKGRALVGNATQTTSTNDTTLTLVHIKDEPRIDSRALAEHLGIQHRSAAKLLIAYADDFRELGVMRFQIAKPSAGSVGGRPEKYALLNEDQVYLLLTYSRNTAKVRALKVRLVKAFREARQSLDLTRTEYLPTYHALHDEIHAKAAQSSNERFVHMNFNRLINKAVDIESGQRRGLDIPRRSMLIVAQHLAQTAMHHAADYKEGYALAKEALNRFGTPLLGGDHAQG